MENKLFRFLFIVLVAIAFSCCEKASFISETVLPSYEESVSDKPITKSIVEDDAYYWFHGEKIFLKKITGKTYLLFDTQSDDFVKSNNRKQIEDELQEISFPGMVYMNSAKGNKNKEKWLIADEGKLRTIQQEKSSGLVYTSSFYQTIPGGLEVGVSNLFYVKLKKVDDVNKLIKLANENSVNVIGYNEFLPQWYTLSCDMNSKGDALQMANMFYETGMFEASEPDLMGYSSASTNTLSFNDTYYNSYQWNLHGQYSINWENAYVLSQGYGVDVAIIDDGIDPLHPDMNFAYGLSGYDTVSRSMDVGNVVYNSHGTACAGIIKAIVNNGRGVAGIAPQATIHSISNPFDNSPNTAQQLSVGLIYASNYDVISCSWGGPDSTLIEDALYYYCFLWGRNGKGCVVIFAVGNNGEEAIAFPANCDDRILAVGASNSYGQRCYFSNYGSSLDVVAPGINIPTTDRSGSLGDNTTDYRLNFNGSSAACPHVAAIAALMLSVNPNLTRAEVNEIIQSTARKVGGYTYSNTTGKSDGTWNVLMGYGLVDAYAAVLEAIERI